MRIHLGPEHLPLPPPPPPQESLFVWGAHQTVPDLFLLLVSAGPVVSSVAGRPRPPVLARCVARGAQGALRAFIHG